MQDWDSAIEDLRREYLRDAPERIEALRQAIARLRAAPGDGDQLYELRRGFHGFSGSGRTYGFTRVSYLGKDGEQRCVAVPQGGSVSVEDLAAWSRLIDEIETELRGGAGERTELGPVPPAGVQDSDLPIEALVVDDDEAITRLVSTRLTAEGYRVRVTHRLDAARAAVAERLPDVLVADVVLPDGSGFALVEEARLAPGGDQVVIFMISVRPEFIDRVEAIHCGADAYFDKPVDWDALVHRLRHLLEARRVATARVLAVEDDPHQAAYCRTVLGSGGYEVRVCADPRSFESDLSTFQPDLVLMDVLLPGANGYDLVRYLRQEEKHATLPVIVLTTEGRPEARISATRAGADDFLVKPVAPGLLLSSVAARIERARFLKSMLDRDGLTRLLTHTAFLERARMLAGRAERRRPSSLLWAMLDVDHFKSINDRFGHPTGDRVLVRLAQHLRTRLRQSDTIGRYGGEEFAVVVEDLSQADALRLFERLREEFAATRHTAPSGEVFQASFSTGIAHWSAEGDDLDAWRDRADEALYAAKRAGRNRVVAHGDHPT
jgi:diguanylate cyclase (GGDEF)-like protein